MKTGKILAIISIVASTFFIFVNIINPANVQFTVNGEVLEFREIPSIYTITDVLVIGVSCFLFGSGLVYLWFSDRKNPELPSMSRSRDWVSVLDGISNSEEKRLVEFIVEEGGTIFQSQLVSKSGYSKTKVSLILDRLEAKRLVERKRNGMSNVIILK